MLESYFERLAQQLAKTGQSLPDNRAAGSEDLDLVLRRRDCAVLNFALSELDSIDLRHDTVRGVFTEGREAFPGARIFSKTHVQIAVRNPECIVGYFRPAEGENAS